MTYSQKAFLDVIVYVVAAMLPIAGYFCNMIVNDLAKKKPNYMKIMIWYNVVITALIIAIYTGIFFYLSIPPIPNPFGK